MLFKNAVLTAPVTITTKGGKFGEYQTCIVHLPDGDPSVNIRKGLPIEDQLFLESKIEVRSIIKNGVVAGELIGLSSSSNDWGSLCSKGK